MGAVESQGQWVWFTKTTSKSTAAGAAVEQVKTVSGPSGAAGTIDVTNLQSTAKEFLMALMDEGAISLSCHYQGAATTLMQGLMRKCRAGRTKSSLSLGFNDTAHTLCSVKGYVTDWSVNAGVDAAVELTANFKITGACSWSSWTP